MKKWILFGLSLLALTASLALSACGTQEQGGETGGNGTTTTAPEAQPVQPAEGGETDGSGTTEGDQTYGTGGGQ